jgi:oligopeptide/dipeptide ABC transporter ATP-binding protein
MPDAQLNRDRIILTGEVPSAENPPAGCRFNTRCEYVQNICLEKEPKLLKNTKNPSHLTACHFFF